MATQVNIAILIGVSAYENASPLPACRTDVNRMRALLEATKKYQEILCIDHETNADHVKTALRAFVRKHQGDSIDECFVYFSGHGVCIQDIALFCCSNYDSSEPHRTSLSSDEVDTLLRAVAPTVAVKVIDACQSGQPYIKDISPRFEKALTRTSLRSFICMASCHRFQSSYATAQASAFTNAWIEAVLNSTKSAILYRDIQASVADKFVNDSSQKPFFVSQCTGLEAFVEDAQGVVKLGQSTAEKFECGHSGTVIAHKSGDGRLEVTISGGDGSALALSSLEHFAHQAQDRSGFPLFVLSRHGRAQKLGMAWVEDGGKRAFELRTDRSMTVIVDVQAETTLLGDNNRATRTEPGISALQCLVAPLGLIRLLHAGIAAEKTTTVKLSLRLDKTRGALLSFDEVDSVLHAGSGWKYRFFNHDSSPCEEGDILVTRDLTWPAADAAIEELLMEVFGELAFYFKFRFGDSSVEHREQVRALIKDLDAWLDSRSSTK